MSRTATYHTTVCWRGEHWGHVVMGNGPEMVFSAPPDAHGHHGVLTPEDAFVAAANTCIMMMFIWASERFKLNLLSYECHAEGTKLIELDRTEIFTHLRFWPAVRIAAGEEPAGVVEARAQRALKAAQKYSLVANSVKSEIIIEPTIEVISEQLRESDMKIEILGTGCYNCIQLESLVADVLQAMGQSDTLVTRISDESLIRQYISLDEIPGLVINGKLASTRDVPPRETLQRWFAQSQQAAAVLEA